jgi:GNAT superfamily N-acetyltransferase
MKATGDPAGTVWAGFRIRVAEPADAQAVRWLDDLCFPPDSLELEPAPPGELEQAVEAGDVRLLEHDGEPVGYLHADTSMPGRIYVSGLAVHPRLQRLGLGPLLIQECLGSLDDQVRDLVPIVTVTSPFNVRMLRVLFRRDFAVRWFVRDYFGPGRHRFGLQLRRRPPHPPAAPSAVSWSTDLDRVYDAVQRRGLLVCGVAGDRGTARYALASYREGEFARGATLP